MSSLYNNTKHRNFISQQQYKTRCRCSLAFPHQSVILHILFLCTFRHTHISLYVAGSCTTISVNERYLARVSLYTNHRTLSMYTLALVTYIEQLTMQFH